MSNASWKIGKAVRGQGRGTDLGFPTANLELDDPSQRPETGVYAAWVKLGDLIYQGAVHVGPIPTFSENKPTVEVHLLDFPYQQLYEQKLAVQFVEKVSDVKKFDSVGELKTSIQLNVDQARDVLGATPPAQSDA
jgi:riboflavin kinase / FMN adenylyltransferase